MSGEAMLKCPYCGSEFRVPHAVSVATCPYCGYTFKVSTGEAITEHYYFKVVFSSSSAFDRLLRFILRNYGAPSDFHTATELRKALLHYVPIHAVHAEATGECIYTEGVWFWSKSYEGDFYEVGDYFILANREPWFSHIVENYRFSLRGREYFKPKMLRMGRYYNIMVSKEDAIKAASDAVVRDLMKDLNTGCNGNKVVKDVKTEYLGVTHYPIWEFTYRYGNVEMKALVDASSGRVIYAEYPQTLKAREEAGLIAGALIGIGAVGGGIGGLVTASGLMAAVMAGAGAIVGLIAALPAIKRAFERVVKTSERVEDWNLLLKAGKLLEEEGVFSITLGY